MGWTNSHLHEFQIGERTIAMVLEDNFDLPDPEDETTIFLKEINFQEGDTFRYLYDFGDYWEHLLEVEKLTAGALSAPSCLRGENACPPEDCGGIHGYANLLEILKNPEDPEYDSWLQWLPNGFSPAVFDIDKVNTELAKFGAWHRKHPRAKATPWHQI